VANGRLSLLLRGVPCCAQLLQWSGFTILRNENAHVLVRSLLDGSGQIDVQQAGEKLRDLRRYRNWADYDWTVSWIRPMLWPG